MVNRYQKLTEEILELEQEISTLNNEIEDLERQLQGSRDAMASGGLSGQAYAERLDNKIRTITEEKSVIAVICERSFEMYGAVYGIIRGGNAYLPIDPNYPQDRIDYILQNSEAKAVIAQDKFCHLAGKTKCIDMTEFIENLLKKAAVVCKRTELSAKEISEVNPYRLVEVVE